MGPGGLGGCWTPALPFGWGSAPLPARLSLPPCRISSVWPKIPPAAVLFSAGLTGTRLRHCRESVPPPHSLRAPQGGGPAWRRQLRASIPSAFRLLCPFTQLLSQAPRSLTALENASTPFPPASVSPAAISFALGGCSRHPGAPPRSCCQRPKHHRPLQPPPSAAFGASPGCGKDGANVPLTKLKMSPRLCGAGRAGARSSRARSRRRGSALAMLGLLVPPPRGRRALYSGRLHQLMWLLLSHPNSWHWGSVVMPWPGQENSDACAARRCHDGDVSPCRHVTVPRRRCQPALRQLLWPKANAK